MFVQVTFSENSRPYTYMAPASMKIEVGDIVSVPVRYDNHLKARVISVSENPFRGFALDELKSVKEVVHRVHEEVAPKVVEPVKTVSREELVKAAEVLLGTMEHYITAEDKLAILRRKAAEGNEDVAALLAAYDILMRG